MFDFDALSHAMTSQTVLCQQIVEAGGGEVLPVDDLQGVSTGSLVDRAGGGGA